MAPITRSLWVKGRLVWPRCVMKRIRAIVRTTLRTGWILSSNQIDRDPTWVTSGRIIIPANGALHRVKAITGSSWWKAHVLQLEETLSAMWGKKQRPQVSLSCQCIHEIIWHQFKSALCTLKLSTKWKSDITVDITLLRKAQLRKHIISPIIQSIFDYPFSGKPIARDCTQCLFITYQALYRIKWKLHGKCDHVLIRGMTLYI